MWAVIDLETTTRSFAGRKGSPFIEDNWVVMVGWCTKDNQAPSGIRLPHDGWDERLGELFIGLLGKSQVLVGQNIKFDILHIIRDEAAYGAWQDWVANGGQVWDLQLVEYILDGQDQNSHMLSLNELASRYNEDMKIDEVKVLWEAGVDTPDIDPDLLASYLLGEDLPNGGRREGDIGVTRNIFLKQLERVKKAGMGPLVWTESGALICSIEMERNGMMVDKARGLAIAEEMRGELSQIRETLNGFLPKNLPFEFAWGNRYHLSPVIFGGDIRYDRREYQLKTGEYTFTPPDVSGDKRYAYAQKDEAHYVLADGSTMECSLWEHLYNTEHGFADNEDKTRVKYQSGKNAGEYKTKKVKADDYTKPKSRMGSDTITFPGYAVAKPEWASSTPGLYSVAAEVIEELTESSDVPFLKELGRFTTLTKDVNTYFITEDGTKGMLTLVGDDGIIHHGINHTSTVTGRLSSSRP